MVTGASGDIGVSMMRALVNEVSRTPDVTIDALLFTYFRNVERARQVCAEFPRAHAVLLDQGDRDSLQACADHMTRAGVNVLINNAALGSVNGQTYADDVSGPLFDTFMRVNTCGPVFLSERLIAHWVATNAAGGTVINVSSVGAAVAFPSMQSGDSASKSALDAYTRHAAATHAGRGITCVSIAPGATRTQMLGRSEEKMGRAFEDLLPMRRLIEPAEIGECVAVMIVRNLFPLFNGTTLDMSMALALRGGF